MVVAQQLSDRDMTNRDTVAERLIGILSDDVIIRVTDEAHFHKQNFRYWTEENPQQLHQRPLPSARVTGMEWRTSESKALISLRRRWECSYSNICSLCRNVTELPHTRTELSSN
jgi:hypothetical protein